MQYLITVLIALGSALMVYNIIRYSIFIRKRRKLERKTFSGIRIILPLLLLIFFLIAYVIVGLTGIADILIASILFGGSVFVFLLLWVLLSTIDRIADTEQILAARYDDIKQEIGALTKDSLCYFHVNLTKDEIEERGGEYLYETDYQYDTYSELIAARGVNLIDPGYAGTNQALFKRDGLLEHYRNGNTSASEIVLVKRKDGYPSFAKFEATLTEKPVSGDVMAFIVEKPYNEEVIKQALLERVLMDQYDRIAYIIEGRYQVLISNAGKKKNLLLKDDQDDSYESIYYNYILPALIREPGDTSPNPLRLSVIEKALEDNEYYEVNVPFTVNEKKVYKHFVFYTIDAKAKFYLMLLSDSSSVPEERDEENVVPAEPSASASDDVKNDLPAANEPETAPEPEQPEPPTDRRRLLVVDDNEINREIANLLLTGDGYDVDLAVDGRDAIEKLTQSVGKVYDVVLMDVQMPVMNGYEATAAIRALDDERLATVPIIAMTANAFQEDQDRARDAGMNGYVTKPIDPAAVRAALEKVLG